MKMSRRKLYNLLRESVISEQAPNQPTSGGFGSGAPPAKSTPKAGSKDWDQYVKATSKGGMVRDSWELLQNNIDRVQSNSKSSPSNFDNSYSGWVKWYNTCRKDKKIMSSLGKNVGAHITPAEMMVVYASFIPPKSSNKEIVADLVGDIFNTGVEEEERIKVFRAAMLAKREEDAKAFLESLIKGEEVEQSLEDKIRQGLQDNMDKLHKSAEERRKAGEVQMRKDQEKREQEYEDSFVLPDGRTKGQVRKEKEEKSKNESYRRRAKKLTRGQIRNIVESTFFRGY